jgi:hypothetical protein
MNEGNVFVCAMSMKGNRSELCVLPGMEGKARESQIKNQNCVLVTHFHDVFPEFSTRHSVNDILNTFDFFNNESDFQENEKKTLVEETLVFGFHQLQVFFVAKIKNFKSRRGEKFALHHFEGLRWN